MEKNKNVYHKCLHQCYLWHDGQSHDLPSPHSPASTKVTATTSWSPRGLNDLQIIPCFLPDNNECSVISCSSLGSFFLKSECKAPRGWLTWGLKLTAIQREVVLFIVSITSRSHWPTWLKALTLVMWNMIFVSRHWHCSMWAANRL